MTVTDPEQPTAPPSVRDHLANERTLLAWIRTALTVMGLGFLVDRLALDASQAAWQSVAGVGLVLFGALLALAGAYSYLNARRELASGTFRPALGLHLGVVAIVVVGGLVVALFLITS